MDDSNPHPPTSSNDRGEDPADENSGQTGNDSPASPQHQGWVPGEPRQPGTPVQQQWSPPPPADWTPRGPNEWAFPPRASDWAQDDPYRGSGGWNPAPPPPPGWGSGHQPGQPQHPGQGAGWGGGWAGGPGSPPSQPGGWATPWNPEYRTPRPPRTLPSTVIALLLVAAILVGLGIGHGVWKNSLNSGGNASGSFSPFGGNSGNGSGGSGGSTGDTAAIVARCSPSLVDINTSLSYQHDQAAGTGIVLTSDGIILTNNHVISGATSISATDVGNGKTYVGDVIGYDRTHDVAIVKLRGASGLQTATLADSSKVSVGDFIVGIGNAGGVGGTPSSAPGQVTALGQSITANDDSNGTTEQLTGLIQTDANIQPGDSGGALCNSKGQVVGIDTAASAGFSFQTQGNQGFAIPINQAQTIATQIRGGQPSATVHIGQTAFLGVLVNTAASASGATLSNVVPGGPASQAGLQSGDTIVTLGGKTIENPNALTSLIGQYHPGDRVSVSWLDPSGQTHQASVQLGTGPAA